MRSIGWSTPLVVGWALLGAWAGVLSGGCSASPSSTDPSGSGGGGGGTSCSPIPEQCDGIDNDCDGAVDEDCACAAGDTQLCFEGEPTEIDVGECRQGQQTCDATGTWGPCEDQVLPTSEICDGLDNDCDNAIDEDAGTVTCGLGICQVTVESCVDGEPMPCIPGDPHPEGEICAGLDEDCDGDVDEDCNCFNGDEQSCYGGTAETQNVGLCADGTQLCVDGAWAECENDVTPEDELCDGLDNDCDDEIDEGDPGGGAACNTGLPGICAAGTEHCFEGDIECQPNIDPEPELCDGIDNDCDPSTLDGADDPLVGVPCDGNDSDLCEEGVTVCNAGGNVVCNDNTGSLFDLCDGIDNDCDPASPDGSEDPSIGGACDGPDSDLCNEGTLLCSNGTPTCTDNTSGDLDLCDGVDNDCDPSSADGSEDPNIGVACDGSDSDLCPEGTRVCQNGSPVCNDDNNEHDLDVCDGVDNDCDPASPDGSEDPQVGDSCDGQDSDLCEEGTRYCAGGNLLCNDNTGSTLDLCDGADNDCDPSSPDGSEEPNIGNPCDGADSDLCNEGVLVCNGVALVCNDPNDDDPDICDGINNDCDPSSPDGSEDPQIGTACDGGDSDLCNEGTWMCTGGAPVCSDNTGSTIDVCDGADNDCDPSSADGSEDPNLAAPCDGSDSDLCNEGILVCNGVMLVCNDPNDEDVDICDGIDNDCDPASADGSEDPLNGQGCDGPDADLCNEGTYSCAGGMLSCSDNTLNSLEICDGNDNDCDGDIDERDDNPLCTDGQIDLGSVSGDTGVEVVSDSWFDEEWDIVRIREDNLTQQVYLSAQVRLVSPPGTDYDLYVYCLSCGGQLAGSSTNPAGQEDVVDIRRNDVTGDTSFDILIEIRHWSSSVCANWDLTVTGDTPASTVTCN